MNKITRRQTRIFYEPGEIAKDLKDNAVHLDASMNEIINASILFFCNAPTPTKRQILSLLHAYKAKIMDPECTIDIEKRVNQLLK